jgi:hypothetical protein
MATNTRISTAARNAAADGIVDLLDGGSGAAKIRIYDGSQPAGPGTAVSGQTLLAELTCSDPAFGAASSGVATASAITSDTVADATGTASWFRALTSDNTAVIDGSVGTSDADLVLDSVSIVAGGTVAVTAWTVTMPAN